MIIVYVKYLVKYVKRNIFANIVTIEGKMFLLIFVIFSRYIEILNLTLNVLITAKKTPKKVNLQELFCNQKKFHLPVKIFSQNHASWSFKAFISRNSISFFT